MTTALSAHQGVAGLAAGALLHYGAARRPAARHTLLHPRLVRTHPPRSLTAPPECTRRRRRRARDRGSCLAAAGPEEVLLWRPPPWSRCAPGHGRRAPCTRPPRGWGSARLHTSLPCFESSPRRARPLTWAGALVVARWIVLRGHSHCAKFTSFRVSAMRCVACGRTRWPEVKRRGHILFSLLRPLARTQAPFR